MGSDFSIELDEARRRSFRRFLVVSALLHVGLVAAFAFSPSFGKLEAPAGVISVDLVAMPGQPAPRRKPAPAPAPAPAAKPPAPAPAPEPVAKPKPKPPMPEKRVLPQEAPTPTPKPRPKRQEIPPEAVPRREEPEKEYGDVLDQLRAEAGEEEPAAEAPAQPAPAEPAPAAASAPAGGGGSGKPVSAEIADWMRRVRIHVRQNWVVPAAFRQQSISTAVDVELDASGNVIGEPEIARRSGNPWYDDGVVRSTRQASPLPAPPEPGRWTIVFESDE